MLWKGANMSKKDIWKELVLPKSLNNMKMGKNVLAVNDGVDGFMVTIGQSWWWGTIKW
jgi:hypothetical protein